MKRKYLIAGVALFIIAGALLAILIQKKERSLLPTSDKKEQTFHKQEPKKSEPQLPNVSPSDWQLVLVNRENKKEEMNPHLSTISTIQLDSRIIEAASSFLAAAQTINPAVHLISGYRSVAYQEQLFHHYIQQEMTERGISEQEATTIVQTYSQPPGASEHQTGLAMDMSSVNELNQMPKELADKLEELAPQYGFILRFTDETKKSTGIGHEDWHFRYVGVESAQYISKHRLSLEEYIARLKERKK